jgi:hypothetical protein
MHARAPHPAPADRRRGRQTERSDRLARIMLAIGLALMVLVVVVANL